jgi:hypothetical protein
MKKTMAQKEKEWRRLSRKWAHQTITAKELRKCRELENEIGAFRKGINES